MLATAVLALACGNALAEWEFVGAFADSTLFVDRDSIRKAGDRVRMRDMVDYRERQAYGNTAFQSSRVEVEYDCKDRRYRNLGATLHAQHRGEGEPVATFARPEEWQPIPKGSALTRLAEIACGNPLVIKPRERSGNQ